MLLCFKHCFHISFSSLFPRRSLVLELQATRELLVSSLNKVQGLELETKKVPILRGRIRELEKSLNKAVSAEANKG